MKRFVAKVLVVCLLAVGFGGLGSSSARADDPLTQPIVVTLLWVVSQALYPSVVPNDNCAACDQAVEWYASAIVAEPGLVDTAAAAWLSFVNDMVPDPSSPATASGFGTCASLGGWVDSTNYGGVWHNVCNVQAPGGLLELFAWWS